MKRGAPRKLDDEKMDYLIGQFNSTRKTLQELANELGVTRNTIYRYLNRINKEKKYDLEHTNGSGGS